MAINPNLVSIIPASELPTGVPTSAGQFFFFEGNEMKKSPMTEIYELVSSSQSIGTITTSSTIPADGNVWGFAGEGTYPNAGNITVATGKFAILSRVGTTWSKVEVAIENVDIKDDTINFIDLSQYSDNVSNATNGWVNLFENYNQTKIVDFIAIKGFGNIELLRVYDDFSFDVIQTLNLEIDTINYFNVNIELKAGERIGIRCVATGTSKIYYKTDNAIKMRDLLTGEFGTLTISYWYNVRDLTTDEELKRKSTLNNLNSASDINSMYIRPEVLKSGLVKATVKVKSEGKLRLMILKKSGTIFTVKSYIDVNAKIGVNTYNTNLKAIGDGTEYFATFGQVLAFEASGGSGFYEKNPYNYEEVFTASDLTSLPFKFAILIDYVDELVLSEIKYPTLKPYGTLKFRKTTGNFPNIPNVYFSGRWFDKVVGGENTVASINQGAEIFAKVKNTTTVNALFSIITQAGNTPYISVSIDGGSWNRMIITPNLQIASGLSLNEHTVRIVVSGLMEHEDKWIQGNGIAFKGLSVAVGGLIYPIKPQNRYGVFFGDSITEGINVLGVTANSDSNCAEKAFPFVTSNLLDVAPLIVGFGGSGLTVGGSGGVPKAVDVIDWTISGIQENAQEPDFIVINHGTNDSGTPAATYKAALVEFINRIKIKYPAIPIFVMQPFLGYYGTSIVDVISAYNNNVFFVDTTGWGVTYSDSAHPNTLGGITAGTKLSEIIKEKLGGKFFQL